MFLSRFIKNPLFVVGFFMGVKEGFTQYVAVLSTGKCWQTVC